MRILLTNDDGIRAPGIAAMYDALTDVHGAFGGPIADPPGLTTRAPRDVVLPVAPLTVQSATGHGVTFDSPLMVTSVRVGSDMEGVAVDARPADCVKLALSQVWPGRFGDGALPDLVISGINDGANCGINVIYSGTVAAALEAAFLGVPSIAVSLQRGPGCSDFRTAAVWARRVIEMLVSHEMLRPHECVSVNLPVIEEPQAEGTPPRSAPPTFEMPPVRVCAMNTHGLIDQYEHRVNPAGKAYYWASGHGLDFRGTEPGSDVDLLLRGCITVTPLRYDLTAHDRLAHWSAKLSETSER